MSDLTPHGILRTLGAAEKGEGGCIANAYRDHLREQGWLDAHNRLTEAGQAELFRRRWELRQ